MNLNLDNSSPTLPPPHFSKSIVKIFYILFAVIFLLLATMAGSLWYVQNHKLPKGTITATVPELKRDLSATIGLSTMKFPKILKLTTLSLIQFPTDVQQLIPKNSTSLVTHGIAYEQNKTGVQASYILPSQTVSGVMKEFSMHQKTFAELSSAWDTTAGSHTNLVGFYDLGSTVSVSQARMTFVQAGKDVKVIIQTLSLNLPTK